MDLGKLSVSNYGFLSWLFDISSSHIHEMGLSHKSEVETGSRDVEMLVSDFLWAVEYHVLHKLYGR